MHDPSAALEAGAAAPHFPPATARAEAAPPRRLATAVTGDIARVLTVAALLAIVAVGAALRLSQNIWDTVIVDESRGQVEQSAHLHPDERFITSILTELHPPSSPANYFDTDTSALVPYNIKRGDGSGQDTFVYGTLPLYLTKMVSAAADWPYDAVDAVTFGNGDAVNSALGAISGGRVGLPEREFTSYDLYVRSGRWLSAVFDVATIVLVFLLGRKLGGRRTGLFAAGLYAFAPFAIQNSHFLIVDPYVTFFAVATLYFAVRSATAGGWRNFALAGLMAGLATACKVTAVALLPVVVLAIGIRAWPGIWPYVADLWAPDKTPPQRDGKALDRSVALLAGGSAVALLVAFLAFWAAMPMAFKSPSVLDFFVLKVGRLGPIPTVYPDVFNPHWLQDQVNQQELLGGSAFPPNVQWIGRSKWIWPLQQMVMWGMGPAFGITAWAGVVFAAAYAYVKRAWVWLVPLSWVLGYFLVMGGQFSLYMRYFLPLYPALAVFAGFVLHKTLDWASSERPFAALGRFGERVSGLRPALPVAARAGVVTVFVMTVLAGLAFYSIYTRPVTRAAASVWVYENVPEGACIGHEHWDDHVPYSQPAIAAVSYCDVTFENYNIDTEAKVTALLDKLDQVDYIIPSSTRLSTTIPRVPAVYPVTSRYYEALAAGELGFERVAAFESFPSIFGREFNDIGAEESFHVYDHPPVYVYMKTEAYSRERAIEVLGADAFIEGVQTTPKNSGQNALQFRPEIAAEQKAGGTWTDIFDADGVTNRFPLLSFLLVAEVAALALVPLAFATFRGLPDRGYLLTKPLGILALAYLVYVPASTGRIDYSRWLILAVLLVMAGAGVATAYLWRGELRAWFSRHWRLALGFEAVFLLSFLFSYWIRLQNPDLWHPVQGGEKPMDLAYFTSVIKTTDFSQGAIDPWHAGGYLNYYWYGQYIAATPTKLLGIVPEVAYNLVVPLFFAMACAATFSVAYNLCEGTRQLMRERRPGGASMSARGPVIAALFAVFLVMFAGNLRSVDYLEQRFQTVSPWDSSIPVVGGILTIAGGLYEAAFGDASFRDLVYGYNWWDPSRALSIVPGQHNTVTPITEWPYWTFLLADLHAHLIAIPFSLTVLGVALGAVMNYTRLNAAGAGGEDRRARELASWAIVVVVALIVGALRWINSWDYPPFLLLGAAAILFGERAKEGMFNGRALALALVKIAVMGVLSYVFFYNVAKNYSQAYDSVIQSDQTTALGDYLSHFGVLVFFIFALVAFSLSRAITRTNWIRWIFFGSTRARQPAQTLPVLMALGLAAVAFIWAGTLQRWGVTFFAIAGLVAVAIAAAREVTRPSPIAPLLLFVYALVGLGLGLSGGVEIITLEGDIGRMNTVFKFYLHVWMVWGVAAAFGAWYVFGVMRPQERFLRRLGALNATAVLAPRYALAVIGVLLVALTLVYPYFGTRARIHNRFNPAQGSGNDGLAFMDKGGIYNNYNPETEQGGEHNMQHTRDAINWARQNIDGSPTTFEAIGPSYRSLGSRFSIYAGLPTVMGWGFHQSQQRNLFTSTVQNRERDVYEFYSTEDVFRARQLIEKYDVDYVIVGDEERFNYPENGLVKFEDGLGGFLEMVYENPSIQIWRVIPEGERADGAAARSAP